MSKGCVNGAKENEELYQAQKKAMGCDQIVVSSMHMLSQIECFLLSCECEYGGELVGWKQRAITSGMGG